jgi:hypothetical protein
LDFWPGNRGGPPENVLERRQNTRHQLDQSAVAAPASLRSKSIRLLHLWHLLSLDAPTVAIVWTWFIARAVHLHLPLAGPLAMFLAVWMLYAADRLLDARQLFTSPLHTDDLEARHLFHHRHATAFLTGIAFASIALAALLNHLLPEALKLYTVLGALLFGWFLLIHARATNRRLPKELAVGIFFPAATFIPTVARLPYLRLEMLPQAMLLAAVCSLNCLCIYAWEHPEPRSNAHWSTRYATQHLTALATATTLAGLALAAAAHHTTRWPLALAAAISASLLLALHRLHHRFNSLTLRTSADLALLTPLLFMAGGLR